MIDFLLGVPGKLKTTFDYLGAYLSPTRCAKIDKLDANVSSRTSSAVWTNAHADKVALITVDPCAQAPIAANFGTSVSVITATEVIGGMPGMTESSHHAVGYSDAVNITGSGVLKMAILTASYNESTVGEITIIVDDVTIVNAATISVNVSGNYGVRPVVGLLGIDVSANKVTGFSMDHIPFKTSLVIKGRRVSGSGIVRIFHHVHRTA